MRVAFLYNAQDHQLPHSLPVACELSRMGGTSVSVLARTREQLTLAKRLAAFYPGSELRFDLLRPLPVFRGSGGASKWAKRTTLFANRRLLNAFDALVLPERTSLQLRWLGVRRPFYIHTFHGPSGHDRPEDPRLGGFDLLLAPSERRLKRIRAVTNIRPGHSIAVGSSKLDLVRRMARSRPVLFRNNRPVVLYNPHHWPQKSSWPLMGQEILESFRHRTDFNVIFAPHVRLFDPPERHLAAFRQFSGLEHVLIDLGSQRSIDMTYTQAADIYLGDVSSQAFEFIVRPRPCIFLNPHGLPWRDADDFASWHLGRVVETLPGLDEALRTVKQWAPQYESAQRKAVEVQFPEFGMPAPLRAAAAIAAFVRDGELTANWDYERPLVDREALRAAGKAG